MRWIMCHAVGCLILRSLASLALEMPLRFVVTRYNAMHHNYEVPVGINRITWAGQEELDRLRKQFQ